VVEAAESSGYVLRTPSGRTAAARRAANMAAREFDCQIAAKLDEVRGLMLLRRIVTCLPGDLLRRQWIPALDDAGEVRWKPPAE
jgi:hypothetical protein